MQTPPHNLEAEKAILAKCLIEPEEIINLATQLKPEHFYKKEHQEIYKAMLELSEAGSPIDMVTVSEKLKGTNVSSMVLIELTNSLVIGGIESHVEIVKANAYLRNFIRTAQLYITRAYAREFDDLYRFKAEIEDKITSLDYSENGQVFRTKEILSDVLENIEKRKTEGPNGIKMHLEKLDFYLSGLQPGDLVILAARPSMGKTALAIQTAMRNALEKKPVYVVTLEMSKEQLVERMLINLSGIDGKKIKNADLHDGEWLTLAHYSQKLSNAALVIDETSNTVADIRAKAKKIKGLQLIVIDYLQLMSGKGDNREQEVSSISRGLKRLAKELKVPVIALSQLNRANEARRDKKPILADLRESGAIEQDADIVMFIHREDYYKDEKDGKAEIILAKHRNGPVGTVKCNYDANTMRFYHDWVQDAMKLKEEKQ